MCYVYSTFHYRLVAWIGDETENIELHAYADADLAGDRATKRSTSGGFLCLEGPCTRFPIAWASKRQGAVSHSTPEAEIVAADYVVQRMGVPGLDLWDFLLRKKVKLIFHDDNQAAIRVCQTGRNPTMRHLGRTHSIDMAYLFECFRRTDFEPVSYTHLTLPTKRIV